MRTGLTLSLINLIKLQHFTTAQLFSQASWNHCVLISQQPAIFFIIRIDWSISISRKNTQTYIISSGPHIIRFSPVVAKKRKNFK